TAIRWNLRAGDWVEVLGLSRCPPDWQGDTSFHYLTKASVLAVLKDARDTLSRELALFPDTLRAELHAVRSVLEAHSKSRSLEEETRQWAAGYFVGTSPCVFEVTTREGKALYDIDRLE